jgi:hypothetical protein
MKTLIQNLPHGLLTEEQANQIHKDLESTLPEDIKLVTRGIKISESEDSYLLAQNGEIKVVKDGEVVYFSKR